MRLAFFVVLALLAVPAAAERATAGHGHHCRKCLPCCCCCAPSDRGATRDAEQNDLRPRGADAIAPIVPSMPYYTMPVMYAAMPVMPMANQPATRSAEPTRSDCCDRVDKLEVEMKRLADSVNEVQTLIRGQTEILKILAEDRKRGYKSE